MEHYLHDGLQVWTPDLLCFGHSTRIYFVRISCLKKNTKKNQHKNE